MLVQLISPLLKRKALLPSGCGRVALALGIYAVLGLSTSGLASDVPMPSGFATAAGNPPAPDTQFTDQNGQRITLGSFRGTVTVVNLWATWCAPCIKEMPSLARLAARLPDAVKVIAVSQDKGGAAAAKPFLDRVDVKGLQVYYDPSGKLFRDFGGRGMPTTFILRGDGAVVARLEGVTEWDAESVVAFLLALAKK
ncbi:TlpA family protein disulfide reductase [Bradyrhizobium sp. WSM 1738]|uniref:TlpA family protein disulfide reductase n=1 Tax=Bradyrhizobium hereditatis TaxID=2821405 RepID=UPI001CE25E35|nr:TlpA disulfide reductase family protein [Bradyrhizobium hereditatis]MCA6118135.1 TlpA family protein disulfide reductase [Bradyrhizobium hereditatis]